MKTLKLRAKLTGEQIAIFNTLTSENDWIWNECLKLQLRLFSHQYYENFQSEFERRLKVLQTEAIEVAIARAEAAGQEISDKAAAAIVAERFNNYTSGYEELIQVPIFFDRNNPHHGQRCDFATCSSVWERDPQSPITVKRPDGSTFDKAGYRVVNVEDYKRVTPEVQVEPRFPTMRKLGTTSAVNELRQECEPPLSPLTKGASDFHGEVQHFTFTQAWRAYLSQKLLHAGMPKWRRQDNAMRSLYASQSDRISLLLDGGVARLECQKFGQIKILMRPEHIIKRMEESEYDDDARSVTITREPSGFYVCIALRTKREVEFKPQIDSLDNAKNAISKIKTRITDKTRLGEIDKKQNALLIDKLMSLKTTIDVSIRSLHFHVNGTKMTGRRAGVDPGIKIVAMFSRDFSIGDGDKWTTDRKHKKRNRKPDSNGKKRRQRSQRGDEKREKKEHEKTAYRLEAGIVQRQSRLSRLMAQRAERDGAPNTKGYSPQTNQEIKLSQQIKRAQERLRNSRNAFYHKISRRITNSHDAIAWEKTQLPNLLRQVKDKPVEDGRYIRNGRTAKRGLIKSLKRRALGDLRSKVAFRMNDSGKLFVDSPAPNSSLRCNCCGSKGIRPRQEVFFCQNDQCEQFEKPQNGDFNAAKNHEQVLDGYDIKTIPFHTIDYQHIAVEIQWWQQELGMLQTEKKDSVDE